MDALDFLCLLPIIFGPESAASSPEASRDEGCWRSAVEDFAIGAWKVDPRLRFTEPEDDGEDMGAGNINKGFMVVDA